MKCSYQSLNDLHDDRLFAKLTLNEDPTDIKESERRSIAFYDEHYCLGSIQFLIYGKVMCAHL